MRRVIILETFATLGVTGFILTSSLMSSSATDQTRVTTDAQNTTPPLTIVISESNAT